ncbi:MAG: Uma2 family endonuclease [Chloroflexota bacterium]|nr:Uma2 family endonuclease [Chloroflexota bacterium]
MVTTTHQWTIEELERGGAPEGRWELIAGELVEMAPAGERHGRIGAMAIYRISAHVIPRRLGSVFNADTGFVVSTEPEMVRVPDVAFVRRERLATDRDERRFFRGAPDLAVEVVSPGDSPTEVVAKAAMWINAGATLVWLADPDTRRVTVFERGQTPRILTAAETLDGGAAVPGLQLPVADLFAD